MRAIVAGSGYAVQYVQAILSLHQTELVGILARGSERSRRLAAQFGVPLLTRVQDLPERVDFACVAVRDGTWGSRVACDLLERDINVLLEHPIGPNELSDVLNKAKRKGLRVNVKRALQPITDRNEVHRGCSQIARTGGDHSLFGNHQPQNTVFND